MARRQLFAHVRQANTRTQSRLQACAVVDDTHTQALVDTLRHHLDVAGAWTGFDAVLDRILDQGDQQRGRKRQRA